ncbi:IS1380 family transposase, partial [Enterococcus faecium]
MTSLHDNQMKFNSTMIISHTGGCLSSDSGLVLMKELMDTLQFSKLAKHFLHIED